MSVLQVGRIESSLAGALKAKYQALQLPNDSTRSFLLAEHGPSVTAIVDSGPPGVDADLMNALTPVGQRRLVSRNDAFILRDLFNYTINDPDSFNVVGTYYMHTDTNGKLVIRGVSADSVVLSLCGRWLRSAGASRPFHLRTVALVML